MHIFDRESFHLLEIPRANLRIGRLCFAVTPKGISAANVAKNLGANFPEKILYFYDRKKDLDKFGETKDMKGIYFTPQEITRYLYR